jgi:CCR4-NOT transcription complex subunit 1
MVKTSVERALVFGDDSGEKRPADRLDFRYIDSFVKLVVVLLSMFNLSKHEFLTKIFEFIGEALDEDHRVKKAEFNQRPYYRMLMNLLTAISHPHYFNSKTQLLILYSAADLLKNLNPQKYPAFCFAWLELISHKSFMPLFLKPGPN